MSLTNFNYNGKVIAQREDGFINLTQMCEVNNKRLDVFMKTKKAQDYITALERSHQMVVTDIVQGGIPENQGTWGHPSLAINLARWISPDFAVWCDGHIFNLMNNGNTSIAQEPQPQPLPKLNPVELINAAEKLENINNATLQELLRNELVDYLSVSQGNKALPTARKEYTICKVRARELGYSTKEIGGGSALGNFVAKHLKHSFKERIGKYDVKHYEVTHELDTVIHNYFGMKKALSD